MNTLYVDETPSSVTEQVLLGILTNTFANKNLLRKLEKHWQCGILL